MPNGKKVGDLFFSLGRLFYICTNKTNSMKLKKTKTITKTIRTFELAHVHETRVQGVHSEAQSMGSGQLQIWNG
jgi:hypothetical protein